MTAHAQASADYGSMTLLLTAPDPALLGKLQRVRPDVRAMAIGAHVPSGPIEGPLWCFVDWLLPDTSGLEMCRRLRDAPATRESHITMVLDGPDPEAKRRALRAGADDYLLGPLDLAKLTERLVLYQAATPRQPGPSRLALGELSVDLVGHQVRYRGKPVLLRPNEFNLLAWFIAHPNEVFGRASLIDRIGKDTAAIDERTVDVWIGRLRRALISHDVPDPLRTVRGLGYVLDSGD